jgi:hypothetical protein
VRCGVLRCDVMARPRDQPRASAVSLFTVVNLFNTSNRRIRR